MELKPGDMVTIVEILTNQKLDFNPDEEKWLDIKGEKKWFINIMEVGNYEKFFDSPEDAREQMQKMFDFAPQYTYRLVCVTSPIKEEVVNEIFS